MSFASMGAKVLKDIFKSTAEQPTEIVKKTPPTVKTIKMPEAPVSLVQRPTK